MKTIVCFLSIWILSLFFLLTAQADDVLDRFYSNTHSIQSDFNQVVARTEGKLIEKSRGHLNIKRPDKFSLEYIEPLEQKYISNGKTLWIYDVELEQVTIKPLDEGLGDSPALLISSDKDVRKNYIVKHLTGSKGYDRVELIAKTENMTFERVILAFNKDILTEMIMYDSFNQVTTLKLSNININQSIPEDTFNFKPPEGVDILGQIQ